MRTRLTLLAAFALITQGLAAPSSTITLPDGVIVKVDLPGYPRGNGGSYGNGNDKVLMCHATSAVDSNGYVVVSISRQAYETHLAHEHRNQNGNKQHRDELYFNGLTCTTTLPS